MMKQRGFSIAEVLTVTVIMGMLLTAMAAIVPTLVHSPVQMQSQVDQVNTAALALYKIRRDFSQGDTNGVLGCSLTPSVSCTPLGPTPTSVQALVVATADDGLGNFKLDPAGTGLPYWQAVYVYWLVPNASGTAYDLMRAYEPAVAPKITWTPSGIPNNVNAALVQPLVSLALTISPPPVLTNYINNMQAGTVGSTSMVTFKLVAGAAGGTNPTQTTFLSNTYARN